MNEFRKAECVRSRIKSALAAGVPVPVALHPPPSHSGLVAIYPRVADPDDAGAYFGCSPDVFKRSPRPEKREPPYNAGPGGEDRISYWERLRSQLRHSQCCTRQLGFSTRCRTALWDAASRGWYSVMVTFTAAPEHYESVCTDGSLWSNHIRRVRRAIDVTVHGSRTGRYDESSDVACVVERGAVGDRVHLHALLSAACFPPRTMVDPKERRKHWRELEPPVEWPYGFEQWLPLRYHEDDNWAKFGHGWPLERDASGKLVPRKIGGPDAVGYYVAKYLSKTFEDDKLKWRTRMSKMYGTRRLRMALMVNPRLPRLLVRDLSSAALIFKMPRSLIGRECVLALRSVYGSGGLTSLASQMMTQPSLWDVAKKESLPPWARTRPNQAIITTCDTLDDSERKAFYEKYAEDEFCAFRAEVLDCVSWTDPEYAEFVRSYS